MESFLDTILSSPLLMGIGALLLVGFALGVALRLVKVALFAVLFLVGYVAYVHFTGAQLPPEMARAEQAVKQAAQQAGTVLREHAEVAGEAVRETATRVGERLEHSFDTTPAAPDIRTAPDTRATDRKD